MLHSSSTENGDEKKPCLWKRTDGLLVLHECAQIERAAFGGGNVDIWIGVDWTPRGDTFTNNACVLSVYPVIWHRGTPPGALATKVICKPVWL